MAKNLFITTTYYLIDTAKATITFCRAGHCPTLYYDSKAGEAGYITLEGMGLGILRSDKYPEYLHEKTIHYQPGDILVMYTDGIIESKDQNGEEFGYERLKEVLNTYKDQSPEKIKNHLIQAVYEFVGEAALPDDDYSLMVLKFLEQH